MIVKCPHCFCYIEILEVNCGIFRHGADENFNQIPPHAPKEICKKKVYGCGKPFKIINNEAIKCDYI